MVCCRLWSCLKNSKFFAFETWTPAKPYYPFRYDTVRTTMHTQRLILLSVVGLFIISRPLFSQESETTTSMFDQPSEVVDHMLIDQLKEKPLGWQFGAHFMVSNPQDSFRRAIEFLQSPGTGYGFSVQLGYYLDPVPVAFGGEFSLNFFGGNSRRYIVPQGPFYDTLRYETLNTHMPVNMHVRLQPNLYTWVYPYAEVVGGFTVVGSTLDITRTNGPTENTDTRTESSLSWQYGFGAGAMVKILDFITLPSSHQRVLLDVRFRFLRGTDVNVPVIKLNDDQSFVINSQTVPSPDVVHCNVGLVIQF